jgi:DNA repair protein RadC
LTAARAVIWAMRAIPPKSIQGSAVMNEDTRASAIALQNASVRKPRARRRNPVESGIDLLKNNPRLSVDEARVLANARAILLRLAGASGVSLNAPSATREYLKTMLAPEERELFIVLALDNRHRLIASDILFAGTIDGASVHPREVVKCALRHNAAAVIFAHNHPSGVAEASQADELITRRLRDALALVDIRTLDHLVVGAGQTLSFAERGLL